MKNKKPFFSIIIPTRNRADTLKYAIKTILNQKFEDYEIIICNNNSIDDTEEIVKSFNTTKIIYMKSNIDLSMTDNFEFAYSKANGKYITYISDNDGFIQGALGYLYKLLKLHKYSIIRWEKSHYNWPSLNSIDKNNLKINLSQSMEILNSQEIINDILLKKKKYQYLPMIYNSFIKKDLVDAIKEKFGRVFNSVSPDISTGFSFAFFEKEYISLNHGITIGSNSAKSNGYNTLIIQNKNKISEDFKNLINSSNIKFHEKIPYVKSLYAYIIETYIKIYQLYYNKEPNLNFIDIYTKIIDELEYIDIDDFNSIKMTILETANFNKDLLDYVKEKLHKSTLKVHKEKQIRNKNGIRKNTLTLYAEEYNLFDIESVCKFVGGFFNYSLNSLAFPTLDRNNFNIITKNSNIAIWGHGSLGNEFQKLIKVHRPDLQLRFIIDSFKERPTNNPPIIIPDNINFADLNFIIITSSFVAEICDTLKNLNINTTKILQFQ